jgi:hypothetical protein
VQRLLLRCLAPDREHRFHSGQELSRELRLCLHPRAAELLDVASSPWRQFVARHALWCVMLAALIPNALAGVFNSAYNQEWNEKIPRDVFWNIQFVVNGIAFPLGLVIVASFVYPVAKRLRAMDSGPPENPARLDVARRALRLGDYIAYLGIAEWAIAGLAYPISLHVLVGGLGWGDYLHFLTSLVLSGLIAAAYPFFLAGFLSARVFLPALYAEHVAGARHVQELEALVRRAATYLFIAGGVPALAITLLMTAGIHSDTPRFALIVLSSVGALGFGAVLLLYRAMQRDSEALGISDL